ncbi:phosphatidylinositol-glycan biosynthesis class X protein [Denticeps clupeoides]|uniref:Phosphatidylinositol-glycan biosynthesis class X protein n=1 Tax=Denticeps clupeoides TaxID=299321 RepID=A0AAY4DBK8_9TELE|nr:phosphatidylinositol-glycan biosynthesis class X protein [Denticeps clupeoides]
MLEMINMYICLFMLLLGICEAATGEHDACPFTAQGFRSLRLLVDVNRRGFHRDLVYSVRHDNGLPADLRVLLIHKLPSGIYMDVYQLESLKKDAGLQVLLNSEVDLEAPAYWSPAFFAFVYPTSHPTMPWHLQAVVPFHGRYHRPSLSGKWEQLVIEPPKLLLKSDICKPLFSSLSHKVIEAPCTAKNYSFCTWIEFDNLQGPKAVTLDLPVGDLSLTLPVCGGTLAITVICSLYLSQTIWKYGTF